MASTTKQNQPSFPSPGVSIPVSTVTTMTYLHYHMALNHPQAPSERPRETFLNCPVTFRPSTLHSAYPHVHVHLLLSTTSSWRTPALLTGLSLLECGLQRQAFRLLECGLRRQAFRLLRSCLHHQCAHKVYSLTPHKMSR